MKSKCITLLCFFTTHFTVYNFNGLYLLQCIFCSHQESHNIRFLYNSNLNIAIISYFMIDTGRHTALGHC